MGQCLTCKNLQIMQIDTNTKSKINLLSYRERFFQKIKEIDTQGKNNLFLSFEIFDIFFKDQIKFCPDPIFSMKWEIGYALRTATKLIDNSDEWIIFIQSSDYKNALIFFNCNDPEDNTDLDIDSQWEYIKDVLNSLVQEIPYQDYSGLQYFRQIYRYLKNQISYLQN